MTQIGIWGPVHGQVATTSNTVAIASALATTTSIKTLATHTHWENSTLERAFLRNNSSSSNEFINFNDMGLDALVRFAKSHKLEPGMVKDYAHPIIKQRLDLLHGTTKRDSLAVSEMNGVLNRIFENIKAFYDLTLVDVNSGSFNNLTKTVIQNSDLLVVCLNQNVSILDRFFIDGEWNDLLGSKPFILALGQYDRNAHMTYSNIARKYKYDGPIYTIPRCADFLSANNESAVIEFFMRNRSNRMKDDENSFFFDEVIRLAKGICGKAGLNWKLYSDRGA